MDEIEFKGNKIEQLPDGRMKITTPEGQIIVMNHDGSVNVNLSTIRRVTLENIFDIKTYVIMREGDLIAHKIEFHDGGQVKIVYTAQGELKEFSGHKIGQTITKENEIIIRSHVAAKDT
jgi:hypothetical protein